MSVVTHAAKWRLLIGAAPVIGVAFFVWAAAQGEADVARSRTAREILAAVAALGTAVAWGTARRLRPAPTVSVATASALARAGPGAGLVGLRGLARALPDAVPLVSPDGELCLWFGCGAPSARAAGAAASVRPFLLVDDSGECIVLPAAAEVSGHGAVPTAAARSGLRGRADLDAALDPQAAERVLRDGDRIHVVGRFTAASPAANELQARAAALVARTEAAQAVIRSGDPRPFRDLRSAALAGAAYVAAPPLVGQGLALPVIAAPGAGQPFIIRIGADEGEGGLYAVLAGVDGLVLLVSCALVAWSLLMPG